MASEGKRPPRLEDCSCCRGSTAGSVELSDLAADKSLARFSLVLGDDELAGDSASLKNMRTGESLSIKISTLADEAENIFE